MDSVIRDIREIVNFVESTSGESAAVQEVDKLKDELDQENERMALLMEEKLDAIQSKKFQIEQEIEKLVEEQERSNVALIQARERKSEAASKLQEKQEKLRLARMRLKEAEDELKKFDEEMKSVQKMADNIPKLKENKQMMYNISKLTFNETKSENIISGFVINPKKDDVNIFKFDTRDKTVSSHFITNYVWDMIAAGVSDDWQKH